MVAAVTQFRDPVLGGKCDGRTTEDGLSSPLLPSGGGGGDHVVGRVANAAGTRKSTALTGTR